MKLDDYAIRGTANDFVNSEPMVWNIANHGGHCWRTYGSWKEMAYTALKDAFGFGVAYIDYTDDDLAEIWRNVCDGAEELGRDGAKSILGARGLI